MQEWEIVNEIYKICNIIEKRYNLQINPMGGNNILRDNLSELITDNFPNIFICKSWFYSKPPEMEYMVSFGIRIFCKKIIEHKPTLELPLAKILIHSKKLQPIDLLVKLERVLLNDI